MVNRNMAETKMFEFEFPVERGKIKEFAKAICDPNPIYRDREYARKIGFKDVLMPVTFPMSLAHHAESENVALEVVKRLGLDPAKTVQGDCEIVFQRPICAGECLRCEIHIGNIHQKEGKRGGMMTFVEVMDTFYDVENCPVVVMRIQIIERG